MTRITQAFPGETELDRRASFEASQQSAVPGTSGHIPFVSTWIPTLERAILHLAPLPSHPFEITTS